MSVMSNLDLMRQEMMEEARKLYPHYEPKTSPTQKPRFINPKGDVFAWYVVGETKLYDLPFPTFFRTKLQAEGHARDLFPEEPTHRRYARIQYREIL